jgi:hypothetical protein
MSNNPQAYYCLSSDIKSDERVIQQLDVKFDLTYHMRTSEDMQRLISHPGMAAEALSIMLSMAASL